MGRWEPDAHGRLMLSAMELYAERGFEQTTVAEIAERAGVTERTFFRYFADKREVLFAGSADLQSGVVDTISRAPADLDPIEVVARAMESTAPFIEGNREYSGQRAAVIAANPSLKERELLKFATLGIAAADALRERGVADLAAELAADTGVTIFRVGYDTWVAGGATADLAQCMRDVLAALRQLTTGEAR